MRRPLRSDEARSVANLAIDLGDPGRMARSRRLHRASGVSEVEINPGVAHVSVSEPGGETFEVSIEIAAQLAPTTAPTAKDLSPSCSCDDDGDACTHALAALLGIAEEIEANGRLLEVWAGEAPTTISTPYTASTADSQGFFEGAWTAHSGASQLSNLRIEQAPSLIVEDIDAAPVIADAVAAIRAGLSRYRSHA